MKIYHMIVARPAAERAGNTGTRKEYLSSRQGAAPVGWVCIGVCGYHEQKQGKHDDWRRDNEN